jgi:prolyl 4-hydroxylase
MYDGVLSDTDCAYLINFSRPYLTSSDVIDPDSQREGMQSNVRTSSGTYLPFELVDIICRYIELKIVQATGEALENSEPMSILFYKPGEYYRPHFDYFDPKLPVSAGLLEDGGQRTASAVTYLAVPGAGGGTSFPELGLTVPPAPGATLWFRNCDERGQVEPRSLHAGDPVEQGGKWVVTKWFRERRTRYLEY